MRNIHPHKSIPKIMGLTLAGICLSCHSSWAAQDTVIGREVALPHHLEDGEEYTIPLADLIDHGRDMLSANWTIQEGRGRPLTKGTGAPLADPDDPLEFPRNFNRVSAPDANSCAGCHNSPFGVPGGAGDIVANVFVLGQRFDFATLSADDDIPTKSNVDEQGNRVNLQTIANSRATLGMFGSGFIEMLARQVTEDLQAIRNSIGPGESRALESKGVSYGQLSRKADGSWDTSEVEGIPAPSLASAGPDSPPNLIIRPFHQAGAVISLRQFSNNAFNHHHGMQSTERFGKDTDPDGDGVVNELTVGDMTAASVFQATMAVPGRMIPNDPVIEGAVLLGETKFQQAGCATCHKPSLALEDEGWIFTEPNPFNPDGNLQPGDAPELSVDLTREELPSPRLPIHSSGKVYVPAFTDLKLHDITYGPEDPNREPLDMNQPAGSEGFHGGNSLFLTRKLWDLANKPNYFHHGQFSTIRQAILAHYGEASESREAFEALSDHERDCIIEFLKTLRVLPPGTPHLVVDENGQEKNWPPAKLMRITRIGDKISMKWRGNNGLYQLERLYQVQRSSDLNSGWENVGEPTAEDVMIDPVAHDKEFYRIKVLPK